VTQNAAIKASIVSAKNNAKASRLEVSNMHIEKTRPNLKRSNLVNALALTLGIAANLVDVIGLFLHDNIKKI